jgi:hypothetical protein
MGFQPFVSIVLSRADVPTSGSESRQDLRLAGLRARGDVRVFTPPAKILANSATRRHALAHILGNGHTDEGLMDDALPLGTRHSLLDDLDELFPGVELGPTAVDQALASSAG